MNKINVKILATNHCLKRVNVGDIGYIDGYLRGGDNNPYAVVCIPGKGLELIPFYSLEVLVNES